MALSLHPRNRRPQFSPAVETLRVEMARHGIRNAEVVRVSRVGQSDVSKILNGWMNHPEKLARIQSAVAKLKGDRK